MNMNKQQGIKSELDRQCEMAWRRGHELGIFYGIVGTLIVAGIIKVFF